MKIPSNSQYYYNIVYLILWFFFWWWCDSIHQTFVYIVLSISKLQPPQSPLTRTKLTHNTQNISISTYTPNIESNPKNDDGFSYSYSSLLLHHQILVVVVCLKEPIWRWRKKQNDEDDEKKQKKKDQTKWSSSYPYIYGLTIKMGSVFGGRLFFFFAMMVRWMDATNAKENNIFKRKFLLEESQERRRDEWRMRK